MMLRFGRVKDLAQSLMFPCDLTPDLTLGDRIGSPLLVDGDPHPSHRQDRDQSDLVARNLGVPERLEQVTPALHHVPFSSPHTCLLRSESERPDLGLALVSSQVVAWGCGGSEKSFDPSGRWARAS